MASKRQIKKAIQNACGDIASECIFAESAFGENKIDEWDSIIIDTALLQQETVKRMNMRFDKKVKDFANRKEYNKARRAFTRQCVKELSDSFRSEVENITKRMNALLPSKK
ncbi:MAG: hypothetical protein IJK93_09110 [Muribaculaceae bacterium]|nr:hypothetical protein [Muribaculaceae bacterium]